MLQLLRMILHSRLHYLLLAASAQLRRSTLLLHPQGALCATAAELCDHPGVAAGAPAAQQYAVTSEAMYHTGSKLQQENKACLQISCELRRGQKL